MAAEPSRIAVAERPPTARAAVRVERAVEQETEPVNHRTPTAVFCADAGRLGVAEDRRRLARLDGTRRQERADAGDPVAVVAVDRRDLPPPKTRSTMPM